MATSVLVLHGPNLPLLGQREIDAQLEARAAKLDASLRIVQANGESGLIDALLEARHDVAGVIVNAGVLAPTAHALAETLALVKLPAFEVRLPGPGALPTSALASAVQEQLCLGGAEGYLRALERLVKAAPFAPRAAEEEEEEAGPPRRSLGRRGEPPAAPARAGKTIGRRSDAAAPETSPAASARTIGRGREPQDEAPKRGEASSGPLTRAQVKERITQRLKGALDAEGLSAWARERWSALQAGADCESGFRETLDTVLLTLMAGAKVTEHMLLAQVAKLDR